MNKMTMYRQGDVLIRQIENIPENSEVKTDASKKIVLAWGEVTGHHHRIENVTDEAQEFTLAGAAGIVRRFLQVFERGATVRHEEHAPIPLPPGVYEIVQQREYTPEAIRNVAD